MRTILQLILLMCLSGSGLYAQQVNMQQLVSFHYQDVRLDKALDGIGESYQLFFSYSKDFIPVEKRVSVKVYNEPLSTALDELLSTTQVVYAAIGNQIVLKVDPEKIIIEDQEEELLGSIDEIILPPIADAQIPTTEEVPVREPRLVKPSPLLRTPDLEPMDWTEEMLMLDEGNFVEFPYREKKKNPFQRVAQISVIPKISSTLRDAADITNNVSVNVLWGKNGGVNGVEVGGLVNKVEGDVRGVQIAGLGNSVEGDVKGVQFGSFFNKCGGSAGVQFSLISNQAQLVEKAQFSFFRNKAGRLNGLQFGLINVVDSTDRGTSIGLLNFVKHGGFNRIEISKSETFDLTLGVKFGSPRFYNIIELSTPRLKGERVFYRHPHHWAIGYGAGVSVSNGKRIDTKIEGVINHVNEEEIWSQKLNLLSQLRLIINLRIGSHFSVFGGPSMNIFISEKYDADTDTFTSRIFRENSATSSITIGTKPRKIQTWMGYKFGFRF